MPDGVADYVGQFRLAGYAGERCIEPALEVIDEGTCPDISDLTALLGALPTNDLLDLVERCNLAERLITKRRVAAE